MNAPHSSHNISDHHYTCYGCGLDWRHADIALPCKDPSKGWGTTSVGSEYAKVITTNPKSHPMAPFIKGDEIEPRPAVMPVILAPSGEKAEYRPTLPPVAHDPLNMREEIDLKGLYPKMDDIGAVTSAMWGRAITDPIERALRKEMGILHKDCTESLEHLQRLLHDQKIVQQRFNDAYGALETILAKYPELLKP